jgi:tetrahydromethanopterin S-methyltransferase subunit B
MEMDQQTIMLASIGDLEVNRRMLILELQARDERIAELEEKLARYEPSMEPQNNGQVVEEVVLP